MTREQRARSSMLWAAWADALGWISELTSAANLRRRTKGRPLDHPMAWQRNIGGRQGVRVSLPAGCYSDDTQLRLATARAINGYEFDVEAFAKVELPVWLNYALGGGRSSKAASAAMAKPTANWANNFYSGWQSAGGNGAAMRIQPHVYAAADLESFRHLDDVIRNTVVTHGHPRAIVGAVFHAVALSVTLITSRVPDSSDFGRMLDVTRSGLEAFQRQPELADLWLPQWERKAETSFATAWNETIDEVGQAIYTSQRAWSDMRRSGADREKARQGYAELVQQLGLDHPDRRGSGTLSAVAGLLLATAFPDHPAQSAQIAAGHLDTDTDTIGTMAAAIVGAGSPRELSSPVLDARYIDSEAVRLTQIATTGRAQRFSYPDLLAWRPPRAAVDAVGYVDGVLTLSGLGELTPFDEPFPNGDSVLQWALTPFGQSVLVKHRRLIRPLEPTAWPVVSSYSDVPAGGRPGGVRPEATLPARKPLTRSQDQPTLFDGTDDGTGRATIADRPLSLENIGQAMVEIAQRPDDEVSRLALEMVRRIRAQEGRT